MVAKLPCEISQPEHVVEEIVHGGPPRRVVAGYGAELRLCLLGHQPRAEDFRPCGARGAPQGHAQGFVPGWEVAGRLVHRLAVVGPEDRVGKDGVYIRVTYIYAYCIARIQYSTRLLGGPPTGARRACRRRE